MAAEVIVVNRSRLLAVSLVVGFVSCMVLVWALYFDLCWRLERNYGFMISVQAAQQSASTVDQAKLRMCIDALDRSCTIGQWGKPCVFKKPGRSPFE